MEGHGYRHGYASSRPVGNLEGSIGAFRAVGRAGVVEKRAGLEWLHENAALSPNSGRPRGAPQIPPLRYAPVGMTILFGNAKYSFQDELHPDRSVPGFPARLH